ncbi:Tat pathway signal sequence domain protein [Kibdelosporangium aridum]|uniref:Tat pathway signal sequence domain protein n=1 Tax=Kibdelosporangium aridum TaxID=2030 RepID=A0A428Z2G7_KIBAR|nr:LamG-like jellyroll fold domain-containing protein [Kibdelosporangium aridum]RSM79467.1 Tat pathway signal sequence domain protein [Kibdelosporangium aridum]
MSKDVGRRTLLQAAFATPVVAGLSTSEAAADYGRTDRFTIAVLPDTQYLLDEGGSDPEPVRESLRAVVQRRREANIVFLTHLGDVTEHGTEREMRTADDVFRSIDGALPYSVLAGNHDVPGRTDDQRGVTPYLNTFGPQRFSRMRTYGGSSPGGYNSYHVISGGGRQWLLLALDWRVSDVGIEWVQQVLDRHKTLPTILTTHDLVDADENAHAVLSEHGKRLWDKLIRRNDQIFLTLNGHYWPPGRATLTNDHGNPVHLHITNYQDRYYGGAGMLRFYTFDMVRNVIDVETFSPWLVGRRDRTPLETENSVLTGDADRFSVEIDFRQRFARFSPPVVPKPRPASAVLIRGTVAYWRFDAEGMTTVKPGSVARDLTGNGNDLTVQYLNTTAPDALTWSEDHHDNQPAHASLRFGGGKQPDRGAILRAGNTAPINSMRFLSGYTIETFIKLPAPFEGDHAFMGILSWEGRSGDAGKQSGWSPEEPTCSLNVSGERFLQFVVYPVPVDDDPTSWSHAIPIGRWTHVAVVNDGRHTVMYVDGAKIARNAAAVSTGITTLGKPFVIGATQFALRYGQGFYGWVGDTRIVGRALRPSEFLTRQ